MLTKEQIKVINNTANYTLVIAGPGTGKTTVLTQKIIHLINDLNYIEHKIHAFTFTNKATREMSSRLNYHLKREHNVCISNFHQYTYALLRDYYNFDLQVISEDSKREIVKNIIEERSIKGLEVNEICKCISMIKNMIPLDERLLSKRLKIIEVYYAYEDYLKNLNKIDFDSMNLEVLKHLKSDETFREFVQDEFAYILVDEAQDINWVQYELLKIISNKCKHLFMVGDPNQCIYSFRGSDLKILSAFIKEFPVEVLHLTINHRSTQALVKSNNMLIFNNINSFNAELVSYNEEGISPIYKKIDYTTTAGRYIAGIIKKYVEVGKYKYSDFAILFRMNESRGIYDQMLSKYGIPHYLYGIGFLEYKEIKYILSYYRIILNHDDNEAFSIVCNVPKRGIGDVLLSQIRLKAYTTKKSYYEIAKEMNNPTINPFIDIIDELTEQMQFLNYSDFFDMIVEVIEVNKFSKGYDDLKRRKNNISALKQLFIEFKEENYLEPLTTFLNNLTMKPEKENDNDKVKLMTIHQSKGLEAKVVFIVDVRDETIPGKNRNNMEEERRVFYVGCTRAKEMLYVITTEKNGPRDKHRNIESRFIKELGI